MFTSSYGRNDRTWLLQSHISTQRKLNKSKLSMINTIVIVWPKSKICNVKFTFNFFRHTSNIIQTVGLLFFFFKQKMCVTEKVAVAIKEQLFTKGKKGVMPKWSKASSSVMSSSTENVTWMLEFARCESLLCNVFDDDRGKQLMLSPLTAQCPFKTCSLVHSKFFSL